MLEPSGRARVSRLDTISTTDRTSAERYSQTVRRHVSSKHTCTRERNYAAVHPGRRPCSGGHNLRTENGLIKV